MQRNLRSLFSQIFQIKELCVLVSYKSVLDRLFLRKMPLVFSTLIYDYVVAVVSFLIMIHSGKDSENVYEQTRPFETVSLTESCENPLVPS